MLINFCAIELLIYQRLRKLKYESRWFDEVRPPKDLEELKESTKYGYFIEDPTGRLAVWKPANQFQDYIAKQRSTKDE